MLLRLLFAVCLATSASAVAQGFADQDRAARVQALIPEVDKIFAEEIGKQHLPGMAYGIIMDGKLVHSKALGYANLESKVPAASDTRFRIASMSKSFVAMAAIKLRDEGKLGLDDPVSRYLPELRKLRLPTTDSPELSVRMLMTMTTGLPEDNPWGDRQMALTSDTLAKLYKGGLSFSTVPGQEYEYSNLGFIMLGKVVSKVSGMRFQDYVTKTILLPLGMTSTTWEYDKVPADKLALGYHWLNNGWQREPMLHDGDGAAMGGLLTTIEDLARYTAFHLDAWPARDGAERGPIKRASVREMQLPRAFAGLEGKATLLDGVTPNPRVHFYSYGLTWARDASGVVIVGHGGGLPGFGSQIRFAPDHGIGVIAFSNLRYGKMIRPANKTLSTLIERGALPARAAGAAPVLLTRQQQVVQLIQSWDEKLGADIVADNFFLDRSRADWMATAREQLATIGKVQSVGQIKADNALRGTFPLVGEKGTLNVRVTLTPELEPKVQYLDISPAPAAPTAVLVTNTSYSLLDKEMSSVNDVIALLKANKASKILVRFDSSITDNYERIGMLIFGAQRNGIEVEAGPSAK